MSLITAGATKMFKRAGGVALDFLGCRHIASHMECRIGELQVYVAMAALYEAASY
jgi:hypothetical protein